MITVSKHAALRYLCRIKGMPEYLATREFDRNGTAVLKEMVPERVRERMLRFGDGTYGVNGYRLVVKDRHVITTLYSEPLKTAPIREKLRKGSKRRMAYGQR